MTNPIFKQITIIGLGLIGSSIARGVRKNNLAERIIAYDQDELSLTYAIKEKFIDEAANNIGESVSDSELVIIATPPATLADISKEIATSLSDRTIVIDVASVKRPAISAIEDNLPQNVIFMPTHPIAGSERTGVRSGRDDLFKQRRIIITPEQPPEDELLNKLTNFWGAMGARLEGMPADTHDLIYAYMSHLPQLIAFCVTEPLGEFYKRELEDPQQNNIYKTFLRITSSDSELWADIFAQNSENLLKGLDRYIDAIAYVQRELQTAPKSEESKADEVIAYTRLFPRIVASCLITTVMEAEKNTGISFAKYAGTGFADFTTPALLPPDEDTESISAQYKQVEKILDAFLLRLKQFRHALVSRQ
ncbi:MAG: prephenate dehydrogenase/arogenate dehydrogenase family protein [Rickettsiales bacterium]